MGKVTIFNHNEIRPCYEDGLSRQRVLSETAPEVTLEVCCLLPGQSWQPVLYSKNDKIQIFVFTTEGGIVHAGNQFFAIDDQSVFIPNFDQDKLVIKAGEKELKFLHIVGPMIDVDRRQMFHCQYVLPRFVRFSDTILYTERFTQESGSKIWQHSVIAGRHLGRYTMGWVIGPGPDFVGTHVHPKIDQWYFMLEGSDFNYTAGDEKIHVLEGDISYTPHGTPHGSECGADGFINYLWFELNRAWEEE